MHLSSGILTIPGVHSHVLKQACLSMSFNVFQTIKNISLGSWFTVLYAGAIISLLGHLMMFYLYKFYPLDMVLPFYALFPVFGLILTFFIFGEIPSLVTVIGGIIVITSVFFAQKMR